MTKLPVPDDEALAQSRRLEASIRSEIERAGGWLAFDRYMEMALYAPGLGYYSGGARKFGEEGDFITAPELTPLFGQTLAVQVAQIMLASDNRIVEVGAGTGLLAGDLLLELERCGTLPDDYAILELSGELRARQRASLEQRAPHLLPRVRWFDSLPPRFSGVVIANEVLDAMPVHLLVCNSAGVFERGVAVTETGFQWRDVPVAGMLKDAAARLPLPQPDEGDYVTELNLAAPAWVASWAECLEAGALLLIDYGYPQSEYYLPARTAGTLQCYYRHRAHADPFLWPGLGDITASVDFTAVAEAGFDAGLEVLGYTNQAYFLINCGILDRLAARGREDPATYPRAAAAVQKLTAPHEMGELFKVLALGKNIPAPLTGFCNGDRLGRL